MSIYDRSYMGGENPRGNFRGYPGWGGEFWRTPVGALIAANVAVYIFSFFADGLFGAGSVYSVFELSLENIAFPWTVLTYAFLHANFIHLFLNMVGLYFFGIPLEGRLGAKKFLLVYFAGALASALLWLLSARFFSAVPSGLIGASGAVMAVFACFCATAPNRPLAFLLFFILPVSVKPFTIFKITLAFEALSCLVFEILGENQSGIAYSAHLGGLISGYILAKIYLGKPFSFRKKKEEKVGWQTPTSFKINIENPDDLRDRVDKILDKISSRGFSSLTPEERETLRRARDKI